MKKMAGSTDVEALIREIQRYLRMLEALRAKDRSQPGDGSGRRGGPPPR